MQNVKSTMIDRLLSFIAPHYCSSCGEIGSLLCESCKYDIEQEVISACVACGKLAGVRGICDKCYPLFDRGWCVGERSGGLEELINRYKFERARSAYAPLADLLLSKLPILPLETIIVPVPTVRAHIRQRGYDHTLLIATCVAQSRDLRLEQPLRRIGNTVQRGANKKRRFEQAKTAFEMTSRLNGDVPYLLIDDVVTTGATLCHAAKKMREAGAKTVWVAAVARQPLETTGQ